MRIAIYVQLANRHGTELTMWETLTVSSPEQAQAHCNHVLRNNPQAPTVIGAYYTILSGECD